MTNFSINSILGSILLCPALVFAQPASFTIKGKIGKLNAPATIYLKYRTGGVSVSDSAILQHGVFVLKGTVAEPENATLILQHTPAIPAQAADRKDILWLYVEKGTITISSPDSVSKAIISGSVTNDYNRQLQAGLEPVNNKMKQLRANARKATPEEKSSVKWQMLEDELENERRKVLLEFVRKNPNTIISLNAIQDYGGYFPDANVVEPPFKLLSTEVKNTERGKKYADEIAIMKKTAIGAAAPLFTQKDPEGKPVSLQDFRGKYVLIDFWASWCKPCRAENPNVVKAYTKYKDKNFTVLGVSMDNKSFKAAWLKAIADDKLIWANVADLESRENAVANMYSVSAIPQNFLIDPQGKIIAKNLKGEELDKKLGEIL